MFMVRAFEGFVAARVKLMGALKPRALFARLYAATESAPRKAAMLLALTMLLAKNAVPPRACHRVLLFRSVTASAPDHVTVKVAPEPEPVVDA